MNKFLVLTFALCLLIALGTCHTHTVEAHSAQVVPAMNRLRRETDRCQGSKEMQKCVPALTQSRARP